MTRALLGVFGLACGLCWLLQPSGGLRATQQTFRSSTDVVLLPVTVTGRGDELVRGLSVDDFVVLEDGTPQDVTLFAEGAMGDAVPLHLGLLLDTSGSMERDLSDAATAAIRFVNQLDEAVDVTFVEFSSEVRVSRFSPASYPMLFERVRQPSAGGATALYDAVGMYLAAASSQDGQKVLLLYTDGEDSTSSLSYGRLSEMLRLSDVVVYSIGYLDALYGRSRGMSQLRLNDLSHQTGGQSFYPMGKSALDEIYVRIREELSSRYTLGYVSTNRVADGAWRKVEVKTTRSGTKVRTRPGYFAPIQVR